MRSVGPPDLLLLFLRLQLLRRLWREVSQNAVGAGALNPTRLSIIARSPSIQPLPAAAAIIA